MVMRVTMKNGNENIFFEPVVVKGVLTGFL